MEKREQAIQWWHKLTIAARKMLFEGYKSLYFTPAISPERLTGREIEMIFNVFK